ncbi:MAG: amidase [Myxococcota bacterium]|nr:amidase [Myxococcota bacterium]
MQNLHERSALEHAEAIRNGEYSSEELTRFFLHRIENINPEIFAFVHVTPKKAIKRARQLDSERINAKSSDLPVFHGVPTAIKDLVLTKGDPSRLGSRAYKYFISPYDAPLVKMFNAAGLVSLGKLATSEFGVLPTTEPRIHPPTRNPWNQNCTPGGSSGGSSAAVSAGLVPFAHASDGGGSVRIPSALCHLYGFKPSLSLLGNLHGKYNRTGLSVMGPIARHVRDAAGLLDVMAKRPFGGPDSCLSACDEPPKKLKICIMTRSAIGLADQEIADATVALGKTLETLGHTVETIEPELASLDDFLPVWQFAVSGVPSISEKILMPVTQWLREGAKSVTFERANEVRMKLSDRIKAFMADYDICLSPTVSIGAPKVAEFDDQANPEQWFRNSAQLGGFTAPFNLTHGTAASIPVGLKSNGLPIGAQIAADPGKDHLVLSLSRQLEDALDWNKRNSPLFERQC